MWVRNSIRRARFLAALVTLLSVALGAVALAGVDPEVAEAECPPRPGFTVARTAATLTAGQRYAVPVGPGWIFTLEPIRYGWMLRLRDDEGADLASVTPPYHFVPNPRDIEGWHFRNRANTGPNTGGVNAPQQVRDFIFSDSVDEFAPVERQIASARGKGQLVITGYRLTPPDPGARAGFTRLSFDACLTWPEDWGA